MSSTPKIRSINSKPDLEAMIAQDKKERAEECTTTVNTAIAKLKCRVVVYMIIGEQKIPIGAIISVPLEISIEAQ